MPRTLEETYIRILEHIYDQPEKYVRLAQKAFTWVFCAKRPLVVRELVEALAVDPDIPYEDWTFYDEDVIYEACSNLLVSTTHGRSEPKTIRPFHFSVEHFFAKLSRIRPLQLMNNNLSENMFDDVTTNQTILAHDSTCFLALPYFSREPYDDYDIPEMEYPLKFYTSRFFDGHLSHQSVSDSVRKNVLDLLLSRTGRHIAGIMQLRALDGNSRNLDNAHHFTPYNWEVDSSILIYSTKICDLELLKEEQHRQKWLKTLIPAHTLCSASSNGSITGVIKLLEAGLNPNDPDPTGSSPLYYACQSVHLRICELLISKGAKVNFLGGTFENALQAACYTGHKDIVSLLLANDADINAWGGEMDNCFLAANHHGYIDILSLLLDQGADINVRDRYGGSALHAACLISNSTLVAFLVSKGADINAQDAKNNSVLYYACISDEDNSTICALLLNGGASVDAVGNEHGSALQCACFYNLTETILLLLDKGANINIQGGEYGSPLKAACAGEHTAVVTLLVDKGADVNAHNDAYGTALQMVSAGGEFENHQIESILLGKGAIK